MIPLDDEETEDFKLLAWFLWPFCIEPAIWIITNGWHWAYHMALQGKVT